MTSDSQDRVWQYDADTGERLATFVLTGSGGLDAGTYVFFTDLNGCSPAEAPVIDAGSAVKSRYLSLVPGTAIQRKAFRVTFLDLAGFPDSNGEALWIGPPSAYPEEDLSDPARVFLAAGLQCGPYFHDWSTIDLLHVYGAEIMPQSRYQIQAIHKDCAVAIDDPTSYTPPVEILTGQFGDAVLPFFDGTPDSQQPDFKDVSGLVAKFLAAPDAPEKALAQLQPNVVIPTRSIDFKDISNAVNSFLGIPYADMLFVTGPCTCPSGVTCAAIACGGDSECGGGYCLGGFCTDACGRCSP